MCIYRVGQHVEITDPQLIASLIRRNTKPFGQIVAIDSQAEYPVKVRIDDDPGFQIPFMVGGERCDYTFSFTTNGHHNHGDLQPGLVVVNK